MAEIEELRKKIKERLSELDMVIGWEIGYDPLHATPFFFKNESGLDRLIWSPLCIHNLATYLATLKGNVGVVVKGCDSRSIVQLMQEKLVERERLKIFGVSCRGVIDLVKIRRKIDIGRVERVSFSGEEISIEADGGSHSLPLREVLAQKCATCQYPTPLVYDELIGERLEPLAPATALYQDVDEFESRILSDRFEYWKGQLQRCIRCYACRNACPLCVCRDRCIMESRDPHWITLRTGSTEKLMVQMIHAFHLAGRCTECGECERACPMDIPILMIKKKMNKELRELFDYQAGVDPEQVPPLFTFQVEEKNINERGW